MSAIDYKSLAKRLEMHAECHANVEPYDDEQRQWAADLRTVVSLLEGMTEQAKADAVIGYSMLQWIKLTDRMPNPDEHGRVLIFTEGYDFNGEQVFDVKAETLNECFYADPDDQPEVCRVASHWMPHPTAVLKVESEPTDRCKHGVRFPHECRECEAEPSIEKIQRWRESERLTERKPQPEPIDPHMIVAEDRFPDEPEPTEAQIEQHPDDAAVDRFASAMKAKLAEKRGEGRGGWDDPAQCSTGFLARLLREHVEKGDPLDVGNFAMMLWNRGGATNEAIDVGIPDLRPTEAQIEAAAKWLDHHLPPEIPACSNRTALAVGVLRAALAAEQPEPTEDDDTDRTIEEIADFFNEHGAEANEPTDAQIEAAADVTHDDFDALAVVDSYTRAAPEFDANVLRDFLSRYPQHANKLLFYAARQLNSTPATPEEVEREEVSNEELLRMQSKVLKLLGKARLAATHFCKDCGALWRQCDDYSFSLHLSTRACPRCELESNATQLISLRNERERLRAVAEAHGSALQRAGTAAGLPAGADLHRDLVPAIESLRRWAEKAAYAAAIKACEANAEHEEEARALQRADAARGGDENEELARLRHLSDVRLFNAGISTCAEAIRSLMQEQPK